MNDLFDNTPRRQLKPEEPGTAADVVFIVGGLKAALNSSKTIRDNVMSDVSKALNCEPKDLDFLFETNSDELPDPSVYDFPDSERRRRIIRQNFPDAAE